MMFTLNYFRPGDMISVDFQVSGDSVEAVVDSITADIKSLIYYGLIEQSCNCWATLGDSSGRVVAWFVGSDSDVHWEF